MKQIFEVEWIGGSLAPEWIAALISEYFNKMKYPYQSVTVFGLKGETNESKG
jgi:hypothetical protein